MLENRLYHTKVHHINHTFVQDSVQGNLKQLSALVVKKFLHIPSIMKIELVMLILFKIQLVIKAVCK